MNEAHTEDARQARSEIAAGGLRGEALLERLRQVPSSERDGWLDEALGLPSFVEDLTLPPGGVPYLPCPVDVISSAIEHAGVSRTDVFVDLGAGLGRVAMLVHLLTGATARGVEVQPHLAEQAQDCIRRLGLTAVTVVPGDAAQVPLSGTVFFLYSPFNGPTLQTVLRGLETLAERQRVTICTVDLEFPTPRGFFRRPCNDPALALYRST